MFSDRASQYRLVSSYQLNAKFLYYITIYMLHIYCYRIKEVCIKLVTCNKSKQCIFKLFRSLSRYGKISKVYFFKTKKKTHCGIIHVTNLQILLDSCCNFQSQRESWRRNFLLVDAVGTYCALVSNPGKISVPTNLTLGSLTPELKFITVSSSTQIQWGSSWY